MRFLGVTSFAVAVCLASPAFAGEEIVYRDAPEWVSVSELGTGDLTKGPPELIYDWQHRAENGVVYSYYDRAVRIDNPQSLMTEGTLQINWLPDKGDLIVHKLHIIRGGEVIDVLADGAEFEVIRREMGLERRLLDGQLTATMAVPGLQEGDVLRISHTTEIDDQALGDEIQILQYLPSKPWQVAEGRTIVSWPSDEDIRWQAGPDLSLDPPQERDGYNYLTVALPLEEAEEMPYDAPSRFNRLRVLRASSFEDYKDLSRVMAPHFEEAATIEPGSDLAEEVAGIMHIAKDPMRRMALAVRLVQDDVSYLLNGLEGGNYLPQSAEDTWAKRYGDCKAKSVLLLAILREMGIESETVLVATRGGDAAAELLPVPGNFDHMIVRAVVGGTEYWLDGTTTATRLSNIADVPPFHYALPLRMNGAELMPMAQRDKQTPDNIIAIEMDHSAGIDLPAPFKMTLTFTGPQSSQIRALIDQQNEELIKNMSKGMSSASGGPGEVIDVDLAYDEESASATMVLSGIADADFRYEDGRVINEISVGGIGGQFSPNRAKQEWRDIPVVTRGPARSRFDVQMKLPQGGKGFALVGDAALQDEFANRQVTRNVTLDGDTLVGTFELIQRLGEVAPADIAKEKLASQRISKSTVTLEASDNLRWRWDLSPAERKKVIAPLIEAYDGAVAYADEDDFGPLQARARFLGQAYEFDAALKDYDTLIENEPSRSLYEQRAQVHRSRGDLKAAIADLQTAYDLDLRNSTAFWLAQWMAYDSRADEALQLLDALPIGEDEQGDFADAKATVMAISGNADQGFTVLKEEFERKSPSAGMLNAFCWFRGLNNVQLDGAPEICTRAVERAEYPANVLDSRAMVHFRLGQFDEALTDLNAALELNPGLAASRYLRGIIQLERGENEGRQDIERAVRIAPEIVSRFAHHGIRPKD